MENNTKYTVREVIEETANVVTLKLRCEDRLIEYKAGQFITVFFPETGHVEGKSYSISSSPLEKTLNLTVKGVGTFSNKLIAMKVGDVINASLPYGYFYSESENSSLVIVTGGIGIAPFRSMIMESVYKNPNRKILLFYSNKTTESIIFKNEFDNLTEDFPEIFKVNYYITQGNGTTEMKQGRIPVGDVLDLSKNILNREFFICGSISFVRDYWKGLKDSGVSEELIYTEAFF